MILIRTLCAVLLFVSSSILVECRSYNNGLIFYNLETRKAYLPPTISVSRGRGLAKYKYSARGSIWSTFGKPCDCAGPLCGCCVGIKVLQYNFDQKMCANVSYAPPRDEIELEVFLNETATAKYGISARNPSPLCVPIMMGIPMSMCIQMSNIGVQGDNLNMCMDFLVRLASTELFEMHFQCMKVGLQGASWVGSDGQPVIPANEGKIKDEGSYEPPDDYYDESETEQDNEIVLNGKDEENMVEGAQEEEEMGSDEITEEIMDIVKESEKDALEDVAEPIADNEVEGLTQSLNQKQVGDIVTNIMNSINGAKAPEEVSTPFEADANHSESEGVAESSILHGFENAENILGNVESDHISDHRNDHNEISAEILTTNGNLNENSKHPDKRPLKNPSESLEEIQHDLSASKMEEGSQNSESLSNETMQDELSPNNSLENSPQDTQDNGNKTSAMPTESQQKEEFVNTNDAKPTAGGNPNEDKLNNYLELVQTTLATDMAHLMGTNSELTPPQDVDVTSEISNSAAQDNVTITAAIITTTTSKTTVSDKNTAVAAAAAAAVAFTESGDGADKSNNSEWNGKENASAGDSDDDSHENDSDYEDEESEEGENETTEKEMESNVATAIVVPSAVKFGNKTNALNHNEMAHESGSNEESYSNEDSNENTNDELEIVEEQIEHGEQDNTAAEEEDNEKLAAYGATKPAISDQKAPTVDNICCKLKQLPTFNQMQQHDDNNNYTELPQIDTSSTDRLQIVNRTDDTKVLSVKSSTNEILDSIADSGAAATGSAVAVAAANVVPLPLARHSFSLRHQGQGQWQRGQYNSRLSRHYF